MPNEIRELDSTIEIDGALYNVNAKKVENKLTINTVKDGVTSKIEFDGSEPKTIDMPTFKTINGESIVGEGNITITGGGEGGAADTIKVNTDFGDMVYNATITISQSDPLNTGNSGDIWFKY